MERKTLKICSFNCSGFKYRNYDYLRELYKTHDILLLQETWLYDFQADQITNTLPNSRYHAISSMDSRDIGRVGRPYGGCCVVWHGENIAPFSPISNTSSRVCAVVARSQTINLLIISVYMPIDDNSDNNHDLYGDTLNEISALINSNIDCNVVICGDFNVDLCRRSRNQLLFKHFLDDDVVKCISNNHEHVFNIGYTFESATGNRSFIDHAIVSLSMIDDVSGFQILNDALNLSQHLPLSFEVKLNNSITHKVVEDLQWEIDWDRATPAQLLAYRQYLSLELENFHIPNYITQCNNFFCVDHNERLLDLFNALIEIIKGCATISIPRKKVGVRRGLPGWNEFVKPYREKALLWHEIWKSAGSPTQGHLAMIRRQTRAKYHWAVKFVKKNEDIIIKYNTANYLSKRSFSQFWEIIRKMKSVNQSLPGIVDGKTTCRDIANKFAEDYSCLYNSVADNEIDTIRNSLDVSLANSCAVGRCCMSSSHFITPELIKKAIKKLKKGKRDEVYNLSTTGIINAPEVLVDKLSNILTAMLKHGSSDNMFNSCVIKPRPKNRQKSLSDSSNYRAISLCTVFGKLLDYVILFMISDHIETNSLQFAYKPEFSTSLCSFLVSETIQYYRTKGSNVYVLSLDATKAFDKVRYSKLFEKLIERNVCPLIIRWLLNMYLLNNAFVKWKNINSANFKIMNGVKQGGVLSPILFAIYLDPLLEKIHKSGIGCYMGGICGSAFAYADDVIILTPTCSAMRKLIAICEQYSDEFQLTFNPNKCFLMVFSDVDFDSSTIKLQLRNEPIRIVNSCKHLGHTICSNGNIINFDEVIRDMQVKTNIIINEFHCLTYDARAKIFNTQCLTLYGCELWNLQDRNLDKLYTEWRKCCRKIVKLHPRTHNDLIPGLMNSLPIDLMVKKRWLNFFYFRSYP